MLRLISIVAVSLVAATTSFAQAKPATTPPAGTSTTAAPASDTATGPELLDPNSAPANMKVTLPGLKDNVVDNASVFKGFGCSGENKSFPIKWEGAPKDTKSFAVTIHDPDAPTGIGFVHWSVFNLPATTTELPRGAADKLPAGAVQGYTDFGMSSFGGPCPPPGPAHRYIVTVYALKTPKLELDNKATLALLRFMLRDNTLALGRATATYGRAK